jgi:hypothetical protein
MKNRVCFLVFFAFILCSQLMAQQYTAVEFWKMEQDPGYTGLKQQQQAGESLTLQEQNFLVEYKIKLDSYFEKLSDNEKSLYYRNRTTWTEKPGATEIIPEQQDPEVFSGGKSAYTKYIVSSGVFGFVYGSAAAVILELKEGGAVGLPLMAAGASTLIPILTLKEKKVTYNSLSLSIHGKSMGFLHGAALGLLISGDNVDEKLILGLGSLSSIGLGRLGYILGRDKPWSQGRAALYSYYGGLIPFEGLAIDAAFEFEDPRVYAATFLAFGAGGYLIADRVADWNDFTVGDITATSTLAALNGMLGFFIVSDILENSDGRPSLFLIPAAGALAGTIGGHLWLKDARLTKQQGRNTALAASGGVVIGAGLTAIFGVKSTTPYYVVSYITGMTSYAIMVSKYQKSNRLAFFKPEKDNRWEVNLMPQNILLNRKIESLANTKTGKQPVYLPAFAASLRF